MKSTLPRSVKLEDGNAGHTAPLHRALPRRLGVSRGLYARVSAAGDLSRSVHPLRC
jgi:hypothetical protein